MARYPKAPTPFILSDYLKVIREFGFLKHEPKAGVISFEPASGYTLKLWMKVMEFMGDSTIINTWTLSRGGVTIEQGSDPAYLLNYLIRTSVPKIDEGFEKSITNAFRGCMAALKAYPSQHEYAASTVPGKCLVLVVIGPERIEAVRDILTANGQPFPV